MLKICIKLPIKYYLVKLDYIWSNLVLLWPKEQMKNIINCWINIYSFIIESMSPCTYTMSCTGKHKSQTLSSFVNRSISQLYNTNSQRTSNMLLNVYKFFMLISLPKKHEMLTYTRTLPEIKVELKC
jgi:hypothetical protein